MKNKHLSYDDRLEIEKGLKNALSFKAIGKIIDKDCTTISKEIKNHFVTKNTGTLGRDFNNCIYRKECPYKEKGVKCNLKSCSHFQKEECSKLLKPPYVCNGCLNRSKCTLTKHFYYAEQAYKEYKDILKESREGITYNEAELQNLNHILKPLIIDQKQSIHHVVINNKNKIMCSEKEIYNLINAGILDIKNIDLPRKVRFRKRDKTVTYYKIDKQCLVGRTYQDYLNIWKNTLIHQ